MGASLDLPPGMHFPKRGLEMMRESFEQLTEEEIERLCEKDPADKRDQQKET